MGLSGGTSQSEWYLHDIGGARVAERFDMESFTIQAPIGVRRCEPSTSSLLDGVLPRCVRQATIHYQGTVDGTENVQR